MLGTFISVCLPYCLQRQPDGRYAVLNREYKPLGCNTYERIKYGDYPVCIELKGLGPATIRKLSCHGSEDPERIYLYYDGCNPCARAEYMEAYLERLRIMAKLKVS